MTEQMNRKQGLGVGGRGKYSSGRERVHIYQCSSPTRALVRGFGSCRSQGSVVVRRSRW
jgi:hypothetical protein